MPHRIFTRMLPDGKEWSDTVKWDGDLSEQEIVAKEDLLFARYLDYKNRPSVVSENAQESTIQELLEQLLENGENVELNENGEIIFLDEPEQEPPPEYVPPPEPEKPSEEQLNGE